MKPSKLAFHSLSERKIARPLEGLLVAAVFCVSSYRANAQPVVGSSGPDMFAASGAGEVTSAAQTAGVGASALGSISNPDPAPLQFGPIGVRPHFAYRFTYGDGIQSRPGHQVKSAISEISPGLLFKISDTVTVDYTATQTLYSQRDLADFLSHAASLAAGKEVGSWMLGFSQSYGLTSTPLIETGSQTKQETAMTGLNAAWEIGRKLTLSLTLSRNGRYAGPLGDTIEWATTDSLNYAVSKRLGFGAFIGAGYSDISSAPNSAFQSFGGRGNWRVADKLDVALDIGRQARKEQTRAAASTSTPTYTCSLNYKPFELTTFSVSGTRSSTISLYLHEVSDSESWKVGMQQRLLGKLMFTGDFEHTSGSYRPSVTLLTPSRADNGQSFSVGLSATVLKRGNAAVSYQRSTNNSSLDGFGFTSSQIGAQLGYRF